MNKDELDSDVRAVVAHQGLQLISGIFVIFIAIGLLLPTAAGLSLCLLIHGIQFIEEGTNRDIFIALSCLLNVLNFYVLWRLGSTKKRKILTLKKEYVRNVFFFMTLIAYALGHVAVS